MTTNSPNPVDGDVQALIEQCKDNIDTLTVALKHCDQEEAEEIYRNLELQKVALSSLTAKPFEYLTWHQGCRAPDDCEIYSTVAEKSDKSDDGSDAIPVYTTPPAQLLRPVELPDIEENETAFKAGLNSLVDCLEDCGDAEQGLRLALRSISEKWQGVKS